MTSPQVVESSLADRLDRVEQRIVAACHACERQRDDVVLLPVSKRQPTSKLEEALAAGVRRFGESQVQEAVSKAAVLPPDLDWHFIGHLQSNKARAATRLFNTIHSVDRLKIARLLEREAGLQGRRLQGFLQVNLGREPSKKGFDPEGFLDTVQDLADLKHLEIVGLMALPPFEEDPEHCRHWFRRLRALRDDLAKNNPWPRFQGWLSMGMSHDLETAIEEGATHIRIGTSIFGPRAN